MKALIIVLLILTVLMLIPLGIDGGYREGRLILGVRAGMLNIRLLPGRKKWPGLKKLKKKKNRNAAPEPEEETPKKKKLPDRKKLTELIKMALKALGRFRRKLSIDFIRIRFTVAADDPFSTAMGYGAAGAALSALVPLIEEAFVIEERDISVSMDFLSGRAFFEFWITASIHVWEIFYIAAAFGIDWLKMKKTYKRKDGN